MGWVTKREAVLSKCQRSEDTSFKSRENLESGSDGLLFGDKKGSTYRKRGRGI